MGSGQPGSVPLVTSISSSSSSTSTQTYQLLLPFSLSFFSSCFHSKDVLYKNTPQRRELLKKNETKQTHWIGWYFVKPKVKKELCLVWLISSLSRSVCLDITREMVSDVNTNFKYTFSIHGNFVMFELLHFRLLWLPDFKIFYLCFNLFEKFVIFFSIIWEVGFFTCFIIVFKKCSSFLNNCFHERTVFH